MSTERLPSTFTQEKTFTSYKPSQGAHYAQYRRNYHQHFYKILLDTHTSTGGKLSTILDIGCGPGQSVRSLAPQFDHAIGLDPSEGMIATARSLGGATAKGDDIRFEISTASELGSNLEAPIPDGTVDLITASAAAHWFNMDAFWPRAAEILKPGGTVAIWGSSSMRLHPETPNAVAMQAAIDKLYDLIRPFMAPGNLISQDLYAHLPLPWTLGTPVDAFDEATFIRKEWGTGEGSESQSEFYDGQESFDLDTIEHRLSTASPITRWREAHPEAVGTEQDVVRMVRRQIERALRDVGVEEGKEEVRAGVRGVLLVVKKKA